MAAILLAGALGSAYAQEVRLPVVVVYLAGQNVYLNVGADSDLQETDTLAVYRSERQVGNWTVLSVARQRAVVSADGVPFPVTLGDSLTVVFTRRRSASPPSRNALSQDSSQAVRTSLLQGEPGRPERKRPRVAPAIQGRVSMGFIYSGTSTRGTQPGSSRSWRTFESPSTSIRAVIDRLPLDFRLALGMRWAHRRASQRRIEQENSFRLYQFNLERAAPGAAIHMQLGRFANREESFSGFWDGVALSYGTGPLRIGAAAGLQPERANEGYSYALPKYTLFASYRLDDGALRYEADASFHEVRPTDQLLVHTYFGLSQTLRWRSSRLRSVAQLDRDPISQDWMLTRIQLYGSMPMGSHLLAQARYSRRQPYQIWRISDVIGYRREMAGIGLTWKGRSGSVSADATSNHNDRNGQSYTYASYIEFSNVGIPKLGAAVSLSYWSHEDQSAFYVAPALERTFGRWQALLRYRYDASQFGDLLSERHAVETALHVPLSKRTRSSLLLGTDRGDRFIQYRVFATVGIRL